MNTELLSIVSIGLLSVIIVNLAVILDTISGWSKAKARKEKRTSFRLARIISKLVERNVLVLVGMGIDVISHFFLSKCGYNYDTPMFALFFSAICLVVEVYSIREKADKKERAVVDEVVNYLKEMKK